MGDSARGSETLHSLCRSEEVSKGSLSESDLQKIVVMVIDVFGDLYLAQLLD